MVNWKVVLIVLAIAILLMAIGMWLGYRYISEQDDIHYEAHNMNAVVGYTFGIRIHLFGNFSQSNVYDFPLKFNFEKETIYEGD